MAKRWRIPGTARVGVLLLCVGFTVYGGVYYWVNTRTLVPVDIPVSVAPGHIRTGDFPINVEAQFYIQLRFPYGSRSECLDGSELRTRRLSSIGGQAISAPDAGGASDHDVTPGTYLGSFGGKAGHYSLDIEVLSATKSLDRCQPRLEIATSYVTFNELDGLEYLSLRVCTFCVVLGLVMVIVPASAQSEQRSLEESKLRIFASDAADVSVLPLKETPRRSLALLLILGLLGVAVGIAGLAIRADDESFGPSMQVLSLLSIGGGLAALYAYGSAWRRLRKQAVLVARCPCGEQAAWGVTGLHHRRLGERRGWATNPTANLPTIALVSWMAFFVGVMPVWVFDAGAQRSIQGLLVSLPHKELVHAAGALELTAPLVMIDAKGRVYLNYEEINWEELPGRLEVALSVLPARVVYVDGDREVAFMDVARAIDIIEGLDARVILVTPRSKTEN